MKTKNVPSTDTFLWPRLIHISWILLNEELKPVKDFNCMIKPLGFNITEQMAEKHHVSMDELNSNGENIKDVLNHFNETVADAEYIFSHNLYLNAGILAAEFIRATMRNEMEYKESFCLMQEGTYFCKLPNRRGGYKWPSLQELHAVCFNQKFTPSNNARADVIAAARCFIYLKKARALEDIFDDE